MNKELLLDIVITAISFMLSYAVMAFVFDIRSHDNYILFSILYLLVDCSLIIHSYIKPKYKIWNTDNAFLKTLRRSIIACCFTFVFVIALSRQLHAFIWIMIACCFHLIFRYLVDLLRQSGIFYQKNKHRYYLISTIGLASEAIRDFHLDADYYRELSGVVIVDKDMTGEMIDHVPVVSESKKLVEFFTREWVDEVYISLPEPCPYSQTWLKSLREMGFDIYISTRCSLAASETLKDKVYCYHSPSASETNKCNLSPGCMFLKRVFDILGGLIGSIFALIVLVIVAYPLKKASPGPLLYVSDRVGRNGKPFRMLKIRSMCPEADQIKPTLLAQNRYSDARMFKMEWDPRVIGNAVLPDGTHTTGIGEFLRRSCLDEFPQFFNVLLGDMSLVGTRPPTTDEWLTYEPRHRARLAAKPGITGMWQVSGRSDITDFEQVYQLDMEYIHHWSLALDLRIILRTAGIVLEGIFSRK